MNIVVTGATSFVGTGAVKRAAGQRTLRVFCCSQRELRKGGQTLAKWKNTGKSYNFGRRFRKFGVTWLTGWKNTVMCFSMGWRGAGSSSEKDAGIQERSVQDALNAVRTAKALGCRRFSLYRLPGGIRRS